MRSLEEFLGNNNINNQEDIEALCNLADYTRDLITHEEYNNIGELVKYILDNGLYEAFGWMVSTVQEEYDKKQNGKKINDFSINLGKSIKDYDKFMKILEVEDKACESTVKSIKDINGEVDAFFNIQIRKTGKKNMYLTSAENFDVRDNDFILYKLLFANDLKKYIDRVNNGENMINNDENELEI